MPPQPTPQQHFPSVFLPSFLAPGDDVPGMVPAGFPQAPDWTMLLTLFALVFSMLASFQLFCQVGPPMTHDRFAKSDYHQCAVQLPSASRACAEFH